MLEKNNWWERIFGRSTQKQILDLLKEVNERTNQMANTLAELEGILDTVKNGLDDTGTKLTEGFNEVTALIADLRNQLNTVQLPAGAQAKLDAITAKVTELQASSKGLADIVPNT